MLIIKIESEGMPLNRAYPSNLNGRRFLSKEGSDFKKLVAACTLKAYKEQGFIFNPDTHYIASEIFFYSPKMLTKEKKINKKKPDTSNLIKLLEDAVFSTLGIDDCYNLDFHGVFYNYAEKPVIVMVLRAYSMIEKLDPNNLRPHY